MTNPNSKLLFRYQDGAKEIFGDPLALNRQLHGAMAGEVNKYLSRTDPKTNNPGMVLDAWDKLIRATREAFHLVPFDPATGQGATDADAIAVLRSFLSWCAKKKER